MSDDAFRVLGIEKTKDENLIKDAYRTKLRGVNPEDDPTGFVKLREAYEEALRMSKEADSVAWATETPGGIWLRQIAEIYSDFDQRRDPEAWRELFRSDYFEAFDTQEDAKRILLRYLAEHFYLPASVWQLIDGVCEIEERIDAYTEEHPRQFLNFIVDSKKNGILLPLEDFAGAKDADYDAYIRTYFSLRNILEQEDISDAPRLIEELIQSDVSHPFLAAERTRYAIRTKDSEEIRHWAQETEREAGVGTKDAERSLAYLLYISAMGYAELGEWKSVSELLRRIFAIHPEHYGARKIQCELYVHEGEYEKAHEEYVEIYSANPYDGELKEKYQQNLGSVIKLREARSAESSTDADKIDLAWNYYQNNEPRKALDLLLSVTPVLEEDVYSHTNLLGRLYVILDEVDEALPHLQRWIEMIDQTADDHGVKAKKRLSRKPTAYYFISLVWVHRAKKSGDIADISEAIRNIDLAISENTLLNGLQYNHSKASFLFDLRLDEKCMDYCSEQLNKYPGFLPFLVLRQKAAYRLRRQRQVIDDYRAIIAIVPKMASAYALAASAFIEEDMIQEAKEVIQQARQEGLSSPLLELSDLTIMRYETHDSEIRALCANKLERLFSDCESMSAESCDIEEKMEIRLQICFIHMDSGDWGNAQREITRILSVVPGKLSYLVAQVNIFAKLQRYTEAQELLEMYLLSHPDDLGAADRLINIYAILGYHGKIIDLCTNILRQRPGLDGAYRRISREYLEMFERNPDAGILGKARENIERAVAIAPTPNNRITLGQVLLEEREFVLAEEIFLSVIEEDETLAADCRVFLGDISKRRRDFDEAIRQYDLAYKLYGSRYVYRCSMNYAICLEAAHRYDDALDVLGDVSRNQPRCMEAFLIQGRIFIKKIQYHRARASFKTVLILADTNTLRVAAYRGLLSCAVLLKDRQATREILTRSIFARKPNALHQRLQGDYYAMVARKTSKALAFYLVGEKRASTTDDWEAKRLFTARILAIQDMNRDTDARIRLRKDFFEAVHRMYGDLESYLKHPNAPRKRFFEIAQVLLYSGDTAAARQMLERMSDAPACTDCGHKFCVREQWIRVLLLEKQALYEEAIQEFKELYKEGYHREWYFPYAQYIKKKAKQRR